MKYISFLNLLLIQIHCAPQCQAQTKKQWQVTGSVGYAFSLHDRYTYFKELIVENDTVVGGIPKTKTLDAASGIMFDFSRLRPRNGGWYNTLGIQTFIGLPSSFYFDNYLDYPVENAYKQIFSGGYTMAKFGKGFKTNFSRSANFFIQGNLMYGGGWFALKSKSYVTGEKIGSSKFTFAQSFLLTFGGSFEFGTFLKLNRNWEVSLRPTPYFAYQHDRVGLTKF